MNACRPGPFRRRAARRYPPLPAAGRTLRLRGHPAAVDGVPRPLPPGGEALLRVLPARPGEVVAREELAAALAPGRSPSADAHAVTRLRSALGAPEPVQTVIERGRRLPLEGV